MYRISTLSFMVCLLGFPVMSGTNYCGIEMRPFGFVASDLFFDTRQVLAPRDNYALLWPLPVRLDPLRQDINAHGNWGLTPVQTRFGVEGLWNWHRGTLKGLIEGDFLGISDPYTGSFRLRHAYAEIITDHWSLLLGQTWHPMFILDCFPDTISFTNGAPIECLAREPQIRFKATSSQAELILAAIIARDYPSIGPIGTTGDLIRNALIPSLHIQARFFPLQDVVIGAAFDYKRLAPRIESSTGYAVHETIDSVMCEMYAAYNGKRFQWRMKAAYDQNGADLLFLSGFAVRSVDPVTNRQSYANTQAVSGWVDTAYWFHNETVSVGIFGGYTKALGSQHTLFIDPITNQPVVFALDPHLDYVGRVAPRLKYKTNLFQFGAELEITWAAYGRLNNRAQVVNPVPTKNYRLLLEAIYFF